MAEGTWCGGSGWSTAIGRPCGGSCGAGRGGKPVFLVSQEDLELLEILDDRYWAEEGRKALEEFNRSGRKAVPWDKIKERLGL